ncbi:MAG TPA: alpha/beta hydrolase [Gammaproteobacteria bacterium]|nr:alpha/beta hydrolase [Gammaproteobacteria bacterium]
MNRARLERENLVIPGPAGEIEALLERRAHAEPRAIAVICHPHPQFRGSLDNKVVYTLSRAASGAGAAALRFNFRGVGQSAGEYDGGRGESEDLAAAERWLAARCPGAPLWRMGFSFGAAMAIKASIGEPCAILVTVAPPVASLEDYGVREGASPQASRWLLVQGERDDVVSPEAVFAWSERRRPTPEVARFADAGHFFHGRLTELRERVLAFLESASGAGGEIG